MDARRLLDDEQAGWDRFRAIRDRIEPERLEDPTVTPEGWSPKDVLAHVAVWLEYCADVTDGIAAGTWDPATYDGSAEEVQRFNHEQAEAARELPAAEVVERLRSARERARASFAALDAPGDEAWSWFEESGPMHYAKHTHDLLAFVDGTLPDPEVGPLLQRETDAWLELAGALEAVPAAALETPGTDGWSARDAMHHIAAWLDHASPAVAGNGYWYEPGPPAPDDLIERMNAGFLRGGAAVAAADARRAMEDARGRMREAFSSLVAPTDQAKHAFRVATIEHYPEHAAQFRGLAAASEDPA